MTTGVWALVFGVLGVDLLFAWFDIKITARILGIFFVAEVLGALILAVAILVSGGDHGLSAAPVNPLKLFNNHAALVVFGAAAPGIALFGAFWSSSRHPLAVQPAALHLWRAADRRPALLRRAPRSRSRAGSADRHMQELSEDEALRRNATEPLHVGASV